LNDQANKSLWHNLIEKTGIFFGRFGKIAIFGVSNTLSNGTIT
jgi:hypothetical protein